VRHGGGVGLLGLAFAGAANSACIIPDAEIIVREDFVNNGAVRIVEPIAVTQRASAACFELDAFNECPTVPATLPTGLVRGNFCACPDLARDGEALGFFDIFVEDPDIDAEGAPADEVFGVFLLDVDDDSASPEAFVAYRNFLPPDEPAEIFTAGETRVIERANPGLRNWTIGAAVVDLCNDNDGVRLEPGVHELRVVVTDRPWFTRAAVDADGAPLLDESGEPAPEVPVPGVPDLPEGATYDSRAFVFSCRDGVAGGENTGCNCVDPVEQ
jgi:hypothetical protein